MSNYNIRVSTSVHIKFMHWVALKALARRTGRSMSDVLNYILDYVFDDCDNTCNALIKLVGTDNIKEIIYEEMNKQ